MGLTLQQPDPDPHLYLEQVVLFTLSKTIGGGQILRTSFPFLPDTIKISFSLLSDKPFSLLVPVAMEPFLAGILGAAALPFPPLRVTAAVTLKKKITYTMKKSCSC